MSNLNVYEDPSFQKYKKPDAKDLPEITTPKKTDENIKPTVKGLTEEKKRFWGKTIVIALVIIIFNLMWYSDKITLDKWFIAIGNMLLISAMTASYLGGKPDWKSHSKIFTTVLVVILIFMSVAKLEKNRIGSEVDINIGQKMYNEFIDWWKDDSAHANVPRQAAWKTVYQKEFVGVGYTGGDDPDNDGSIYTAVSGKDIFVGYRYTVIDSNFEVWYEGAWKKFDKGAWLPVVKIKTGNKLTFRNEKGKKFTVVVQEKLV